MAFGSMVDPESSALLQVAEAPRHVLWVIEPDPLERVAYVSPSFERIWGRSVAALYADPEEWVAGIHPEDRERVVAAYEHWVAAPRERTYDVEFRVVSPGGAEHWIHDTGHAVVSESGSLQLTGIAEDITAWPESWIQCSVPSGCTTRNSTS